MHALSAGAQVTVPFAHIPDPLAPALARREAGRARRVLAEARLTIVYLRELLRRFPPALVQRRVICRVRHSCRAKGGSDGHGSEQHCDWSSHLRVPLLD